MPYRISGYFIALLFLVGCTPKQEPKTVDYYLVNEAERAAVREKCKNNPGELGGDPDCINASVAERRAEKNAAKNKVLPPIKF